MYDPCKFTLVLVYNPTLHRSIPRGFAQQENESVVRTCSVAYMRAGIGNNRLVVCLSEYLP